MTADTTQRAPLPVDFLSALPFWASLGMLPLAAIGAWLGGWTVLLLPLYAFWLFTLLDALMGLNRVNPDPDTPDSGLKWYRMITLIWVPAQFVLIYGMIFAVTRATHLGLVEKLVLFFGVGTATGAVGIVYAHELMHQRNRLERWLGDLLLASVLYSHFRSEHLLVHHTYVGTPRDAVSARYNEGFHAFFARVLRESALSGWHAEAQMLARRKRGRFHPANPFWRYAILQLAALALAFGVGGLAGLALFLWQAIVAIWLLELTNYIEHYGLSRKHLGDGRYEPVRPHHSWNASHKATNWLMINLQRHSDHHARPDRRFPLLQNHDEAEAPQLPFGYPLMGVIAMVPPLWRRVMNPRVRAWRRQFYAEITDWAPYKDGTLPIPGQRDA